MRLYLAARFSRKAEMAERAAGLRARGYDIGSVWHDRLGDAKPFDGDPQRADEFGRYAFEDGACVRASDALVSFSDGGEKLSHGGKHVELGIALALGKPVLLVGPPENVFHYLPTMGQVEDWKAALDLLAELDKALKHLASGGGDQKEGS